MGEVYLFVLIQVDEVIAISESVLRPPGIKAPTPGISDKAILLLPVVNTGIEVAEDLYLVWAQR